MLGFSHNILSYPIFLGGDDDEEDDEVEEKLPSFGDYIMHFLTIFWKVLFAFVPPTDYLGGWACFTVSITWIAILTALIGDLASMFGCTIGLRDTVTAISFVALGTSVPGNLQYVYHSPQSMFSLTSKYQERK